MNRRTNSRTPTSITGWTRVFTSAWSKPQTPPTPISGAASTAWKKDIIGGSAPSYPCCLSCRRYSIERL